MKIIKTSQYKDEYQKGIWEAFESLLNKNKEKIEANPDPADIVNKIEKKIPDLVREFGYDALQKIVAEKIEKDPSWLDNVNFGRTLKNESISKGFNHPNFINLIVLNPYLDKKYRLEGMKVFIKDMTDEQGEISSNIAYIINNYFSPDFIGKDQDFKNLLLPVINHVLEKNPDSAKYFVRGGYDKLIPQISDVRWNNHINEIKEDLKYVENVLNNEGEPHSTLKGKVISAYESLKNAFSILKYMLFESSIYEEYFKPIWKNRDKKKEITELKKVYYRLLKRYEEIKPQLPDLIKKQREEIFRRLGTPQENIFYEDEKNKDEQNEDDSPKDTGGSWYSRLKKKKQPISDRIKFWAYKKKLQQWAMTLNPVFSYPFIIFLQLNLQNIFQKEGLAAAEEAVKKEIERLNQSPRKMSDAIRQPIAERILVRFVASQKDWFNFFAAVDYLRQKSKWTDNEELSRRTNDFLKKLIQHGYLQENQSRYKLIREIYLPEEIKETEEYETD